MDNLVNLVYYDGISLFESLIRFVIVIIAIHGVSSIIYSVFKGVR